MILNFKKYGLNEEEEVPFNMASFENQFINWNEYELKLLKEFGADEISSSTKEKRPANAIFNQSFEYNGIKYEYYFIIFKLNVENKTDYVINIIFMLNSKKHIKKIRYPKMITIFRQMPDTMKRVEIDFINIIKEENKKIELEQKIKYIKEEDPFAEEDWGEEINKKLRKDDHVEFLKTFTSKINKVKKY